MPDLVLMIRHACMGGTQTYTKLESKNRRVFVKTDMLDARFGDGGGGQEHLMHLKKNGDRIPNLISFLSTTYVTAYPKMALDFRAPHTAARNTCLLVAMGMDDEILSFMNVKEALRPRSGLNLPIFLILSSSGPRQYADTKPALNQ